MIRALLISLTFAPLSAHAVGVGCEYDSLVRFSNGKCIPLVSKGILKQPIAIALGPKGRIFISSRDNGLVLVVSDRGVIKSSWTVEGGPLGLAIDPKRNILYCSTTKKLIAKYTLDGHYLGDLVKFDGPLSLPGSLAITSRGTLYAAIHNENKIIELSPEGAIIRTLGKEGMAVGEFRFPQRIAIDAQDNLWVTEGRGNRIQRIDSNGQARVILTAEQPFSLAISKAALWFTSSGQRFFKYDLRTQKSREIAQLNYVHDIAVRPSGEIFLLFGHPVPK